MTDKPILFNGPMVRAILEGRKTQTRRVLKPTEAAFEAPKFRRGDRLWVREAWQAAPAYDDVKPSDMGGDESILYAADGVWESWGWGDTGCINGGRKRPSIHMPRWASRLTLIVEDVRVQRLQDITEADAMAEGIERLKSRRGFYDPTKSKGAVHLGAYFDWATDAFEVLWNSINGPEAWDANPWVAAYTFRAILANIDSPEALMTDHKDLIERASELARIHLSKQDGTVRGSFHAETGNAILALLDALEGDTDRLAAHDAETYRKGQEDMRERAADAFAAHSSIRMSEYHDCSRSWRHSVYRCILSIPIKEKADE